MFIFTFHMEGSGSNIHQFDQFDVYSLWSYHRIPGQFAVKNPPTPLEHRPSKIKDYPMPNNT